MAKFQIKVNGVDRIIKNLNKKESEIKNAMKDGVNSGSVLVEATSKKIVPVRTGNLMRSIHTEINKSGLEAKVGPDMKQAPYAVYVEFGTRNFKGRHYMERTFLATKTKVKEIITNFIKAKI